MTHSLEEAWALDDDHRGRFGDHTIHGFYTNPSDLHVPHALEAILGCEPTELCLPPQICYESYSATETLLCSVLPLPGVKPGSASNLCQLLTGKAELTLLFGPQL